MNKKELTDKHSFVNDSIFRLKTVVLTGKRMFINLRFPLTKFINRGELNDLPVVSFSESDLWNPNDNKDNWILTAGKIQNLRIASKKINGIEVKANEVFSFWRHIGNPNYGQSYVVGREIREGCIVPTTAGGLCQLSNALYDAALKANFDIVERHRHTKVIKGSLAEKDRDATVKWNYIDLRFKSSFDFRIEVELSSDKLLVSFRSAEKNKTHIDEKIKLRSSNQLNDCFSCANLACFKHPDRSAVKQEIATTTFVLDEKWPEYDAYINQISGKDDKFILPIKRSKLLPTDRYTWTAAKSNNTKYTSFQGWHRALSLRFAPKKKNNVFELSLKHDRKIALAAAQIISIESSHLVVSQNLLPFLMESGALGGRTFDVLMTRLPFEKLHQKLDAAFSLHPRSATLNDFRVDKNFIELENRALTKARKIITPHEEIAALFSNKVEKLEWSKPQVHASSEIGKQVLFPASAVGRKGAYEMKKLASELGFSFVFSGRNIESENFWEDLNVSTFDGDYSKIGLVIYPAHVEHQPRQILKAISLGIPVVITPNCGILPDEKIEVIAPNDFERLKKSVDNQIRKMKF